MLHQTELGNARMDEFIGTTNRYNERRRRQNRGSPLHRFRHVMARQFVLIGARLNGEEPAQIGRVVILDECGNAPGELRPAA